MPDPMLDMLRRDQTEQTFDSECLITSQGEGYLDDDGVWQDNTTTIYEGPCSFLPQSSTRTTESAGATVEIHPYVVKVPQNTPVEHGHVVQITACPDTAAVGEHFTVRAVQYSQWQVSRILGVEQGVT